MATHTRRESTVRRVQFTLPTPCNLRDLHDILDAARIDFVDMRRLDPSIPLTGDAFEITANGPDIVISFEVTE